MQAIHTATTCQNASDNSSAAPARTFTEDFSALYILVGQLESLLELTYENMGGSLFTFITNESERAVMNRSFAIWRNAISLAHDLAIDANERCEAMELEIWTLGRAERDMAKASADRTVSTECMALIEAHRWSLDVATDAIRNTDKNHMMYDPDTPESVREAAIEKLHEALYVLLAYRPRNIAELARVSSYLSKLYIDKKYGAENLDDIFNALSKNAVRLAPHA